ncbi:MAG: glycoside hydrolase family 18 protein [Phycisphaeraceae bacterium]
MRKRLAAFIFIALALGSAGAAEPSEGGEAGGEPMRVIGYLPHYRSIDDVEFHLLTDVIYFSLMPTEAGGIDLTHVREDDLPTLRERAAEHDVRLHIAVGGWDRSKAFAAVTADAAARRRFVSELVAFCREHGFGGVDFDWEWPSDASQWQRYALLLREVDAGFEPHGLEVSVALVHPPTAFDAATWAAIDRVHLMTYDLPGEHAAFDAVMAVVQQWLDAEVVPADRLALGVPFYGRHVETRQTMTYTQLLAEHQPDAKATRVAGFYFDNAATLRRKVEAAAERGLGGIMIWEIGQAPRGTLLQVIAEAVGGRESP